MSRPRKTAITVTPFTEWLRAALRGSTSSRTQVAEAANISGPYLSMLELGRRPPTRKIAAKLARALHRSVGEAQRAADQALPADVSGTPVVLPPGLQSADDWKRSEAYKQFLSRPDRDAVCWSLAVHDKSLYVRETAAEVLATFPALDRIEPFIVDLLKDSAGLVRRAAVRSLARHKNRPRFPPGILHALRELRQGDGDPIVRQRAKAVLGKPDQRAEARREGVHLISDGRFKNMKDPRKWQDKVNSLGNPEDEIALFEEYRDRQPAPPRSRNDATG